MNRVFDLAEEADLYCSRRMIPADAVQLLGIFPMTLCRAFHVQ